MDREPLIVADRRGLYCPPGDFYIDPAKPAQTAVITHAHGDHLRPGSARYILARPGAGLARARLRGRPALTVLDYGTAVAIGRTRVSLHPAGHILGSAQVRIEHEGAVWVVSGDYKRQADPTCAPFEPLACDVFVSEATFAQPEYRWPPTAQVVAEIHCWWQANRERGIASLLYCYALGKAQRVLAELRAFTDEPVHVHTAVGALVDVYRAAGVAMLPTLPVKGWSASELRGALVIAPPSARGTSWVRRIGEHASGFCSGWMLTAPGPGRSGYDRGFVLSDHADWPGLLQTCRESGASRVLLMHGRTETLARCLTEQGVSAGELQPAG